MMKLQIFVSMVLATVTMAGGAMVSSSSEGQLGATRGRPADAQVLFDGTAASVAKNWCALNGKPSKWRVLEGELEATKGSGDIATRAKYADVQLHIEWKTPVNASDYGNMNQGNSGVFFLDRFYEVQVFESFGTNPANMTNKFYADGQAASIYGQNPPLVNPVRKAGEWQVYDIIFRAPKFEGEKCVKPGMMTVFLNGVLVQDGWQLEGPTLHCTRTSQKKPPEKGVLRLQEHGCPVRYRNIWLRELK